MVKLYYAFLERSTPANTVDEALVTLPFPTISSIDGVSIIGSYYESYFDIGSEITLTTNTTLNVDGSIICNTSGGAFTITLPDATTRINKIYCLKNIGSNTLIISTTGGQTIDGAGSSSVLAGRYLTLMSDGSNWISTLLTIRSLLQSYYHDFTNIGAGAGIYKDIVGLNYQLRSIQGTSRLSTTVNSGTIDLDVVRNDAGTGTGDIWSANKIINYISGSTSIGRQYIISDTKTTGTNAGAATRNTWVTRTLNTLDSTGGTSDVSLASNQFTLVPGKYSIFAMVPAYKITSHQARLYNVTDSVVAKYGQSAASVNNSSTHSVIFHVVNILSSKSYRIDHNTNNTGSALSTDFGAATGFAGNSEIYTQVVITRLG